MTTSDVFDDVYQTWRHAAAEERTACLAVEAAREAVGVAAVAYRTATEQLIKARNAEQETRLNWETHQTLQTGHVSEVS